MVAEMSDVADIVERRARRAAARILSFKDRECSDYLPHDVDEKLRSVILDQINELAFCAIDCLNSISEGEPTNQVYVDLLQEILEERRGEGTGNA